MKFGTVSPAFASFSSWLTLIGCTSLILYTEWDSRALALLIVLVGLLFALEYALRIRISYGRGGWRQVRAYVYSFWGFVDLLSALGGLLFWFELQSGAEWVRFARLLRLVWFINLIEVSLIENLMISALKRVRHELSLAAALTAILMIFCAALMHLAEGPVQPEQFGSIPRALWWAVATLTTVGYGDVVPVTAVGRLIASGLALLGIAVVALPAGLIGAAISDEINARRNAQAEAEAEEDS